MWDDRAKEKVFRVKFKISFETIKKYLAKVKKECVKFVKILKTL